MFEVGGLKPDFDALRHVLDHCCSEESRLDQGQLEERDGYVRVNDGCDPPRGTLAERVKEHPLMLPISASLQSCY